MWIDVKSPFEDLPKDEVVRREHYDLLEIGCFGYDRIGGV
jgi:hypothetical protein